MNYTRRNFLHALSVAMGGTALSSSGLVALDAAFSRALAQQARARGVVPPITFLSPILIAQLGRFHRGRPAHQSHLEPARHRGGCPPGDRAKPVGRSHRRASRAAVSRRVLRWRARPL